MDVASLLAKAREVFPNDAIAVVHVSKRDVSTGRKSEQVAIETAKRTYAFGSMDDATRALMLCIDLVPGTPAPVVHEHHHVPADETPPPQSSDEAPSAVEPAPTPISAPVSQGGQQVRVQVAAGAPLLSI